MVDSRAVMGAFFTTLESVSSVTSGGNVLCSLNSTQCLDRFWQNDLVSMAVNERN